MSQPKAGRRAAELRKQMLRLRRTRQEDFQVTLSRYGVERLLYRLSKSRFVDGHRFPRISDPTRAVWRAAAAAMNLCCKVQLTRAVPSVDSDEPNGGAEVLIESSSICFSPFTLRSLDFVVVIIVAFAVPPWLTLCICTEHSSMASRLNAKLLLFLLLALGGLAV